MDELTISAPFGDHAIGELQRSDSCLLSTMGASQIRGEPFNSGGGLDFSNMCLRTNLPDF